MSNCQILGGDSGSEPLHIVEIRVGEYLGEDDFNAMKTTTADSRIKKKG